MADNANSSLTDQVKPSFTRGGRGKLFSNIALLTVFSMALRATEMVVTGGASPLSAMFDVAASDLSFAKKTVVDPALEYVGGIG